MRSLKAGWERFRSRFWPATKSDLEEATNRILMKQAEALAVLVTVRDQLQKAKTEIVTKIDALVAAAQDMETTPEFDAALNDVKSISQTLDDVVPDSVPSTGPIPPS